MKWSIRVYQILNYEREEAKTVVLTCEKVAKIGARWLEQKLLTLKVGLPNESNILQDRNYKFLPKFSKMPPKGIRKNDALAPGRDGGQKLTTKLLLALGAIRSSWTARFPPATSKSSGPNPDSVNLMSTAAASPML
jgi:hypothetical protein